jgi:hypothetical protein
MPRLRQVTAEKCGHGRRPGCRIPISADDGRRFGKAGLDLDMPLRAFRQFALLQQQSESQLRAPEQGCVPSFTEASGIR